MGALSGMVPSVSQADGMGDWKIAATIYGWLPSINGTVSAPADSGGTSITVDSSEVLVALKFTFTGLLEADLKWHRGGDISGLPLPRPDGKGNASDAAWDAIVRLRGQLKCGEDKRWYMPYYADVGTGDSDVTWQGLLGVGYAFDWGDVVSVCRYLDYDMSSGHTVENVNMSGEAIGFAFHF